MSNFLQNENKKYINEIEESTLNVFRNVRHILWHKFSEEKPKQNGSYLAITSTEVEGYEYGLITTLSYYASVSMFNWNGEGDDTEIKVLYWTNIEDVLPDELKGGDKR